MNTFILSAMGSNSHFVLAFFGTVIAFAFLLNAYYKIKEFNKHRTKIWFDNDTVIVSDENAHVHSRNMTEMKTEQQKDL